MTFACGSGPEKSNNTAASDSALKEQYRLRVDSLKKKNPLLILPPDTEYTGEYLDKWENGLVKFRGQFRFGKRHGQWVSFYPNGEPWSELHYDKGNRHGPYLVYYPKMIKRIEGYYKNDMRDSIWNFYDSTGFKAAVIVYSKNKVVKSDYFKNPRFKRQLKIETKE
ncbi:MAG: hypothetical protein N3F09_00995 [Bacteroidia bacterium]|nr:hypothetical protein [Bacteroidia bacterium]